MRPEVHTITTAAVGMSHDQRTRQRVYLISMGVRTACFLGAIVTPSPVRWVLAGAAVVLPYFAVVVANVGRDRSGSTAVPLVDRNALGSRDT